MTGTHGGYLQVKEKVSEQEGEGVGERGMRDAVGVVRAGGTGTQRALAVHVWRGRASG